MKKQRKRKAKKVVRTCLCCGKVLPAKPWEHVCTCTGYLQCAPHLFATPEPEFSPELLAGRFVHPPSYDFSEDDIPF